MWTRRAFLAAAGLAPASIALASTTPLPVVASFSILGDFVRAVGRARIELTTIVGPNGDAHVYEPAPRDGRALAKARLIFVNGLGFEGWIEQARRPLEDQGADRDSEQIREGAAR